MNGGQRYMSDICYMTYIDKYTMRILPLKKTSTVDKFVKLRYIKRL